MAHRQYLRKFDPLVQFPPATYCVANNYIDPTNPAQVEDAGLINNPILPEDGWNLLLTFQNNSPNSTTFDPAITASSGSYAWDLGDGTILVGDKSISHTYLTTATRTVKLYGKGTCTITAVNMDSDNIVGVLDLSNAAFASVTNYSIQTNPLMTGVTFASTITAVVNYFNIFSTGIVGTLDMSMFKKYATNTQIALQLNPTLTGVTFASSLTTVGTLHFFQIFSSGITGTLDLSMFTAYSTSATFELYSNPTMTGLTLASSLSTGTVAQFKAYSTGITGNLNLSCINKFTTSGYMQIHSNPNMTGVTFASSITGTVQYLHIYSTGITGVLDLSKFTTFTTASNSILLNNNPNMTGVTFASSITGTIYNFAIHTTGITGTLDLSKFTTFSALGATIDMHSNPSMTGLTLASSITGVIGMFYAYSSGITGNLDLSKITSWGTNCDIQLYGNASMTGVTFANSMTGVISKMYIHSTGITGVLDISKFTGFSTGDLDFHSNASLTGITFNSSLTGVVKYLRLDGSPLVGYMDLSKLSTAVINLSWQLQNNAWGADIVNHYLNVINTVAVAGYAGRVINVGGTNTDPDTTSGGYDGVAARTALIGKSFTITIT